MSFFSSLFSSSVTTPVQYCFPYFFDERQFKRQIEKLDLSYALTINENTDLYNPLSIFNNSGFSLQIDYFNCVMFDSLGSMLIWNNEEDRIRISKVNLINGVLKKVDFDISLLDFKQGKNQLDVDYGLSNFITYVRKKDIKYNLQYFEKFAIVIINQNNINIIPFDWFNKTGGDYGYVWPAIAQLDLNSFELNGKGMRMGDFKVQLHDQI